MEAPGIRGLLRPFGQGATAAGRRGGRPSAQSDHNLTSPATTITETNTRAETGPVPAAFGEVNGPILPTEGKFWRHSTMAWEPISETKMRKPRAKPRQQSSTSDEGQNIRLLGTVQFIRILPFPYCAATLRTSDADIVIGQGLIVQSGCVLRRKPHETGGRPEGFESMKWFVKICTSVTAQTSWPEPTTGKPQMFKRDDPPGTLSPLSPEWTTAAWSAVETVKDQSA